MTERKRILMVLAHKDDETYGAGTAYKAAQAGHEVFMLAITDGRLGSRNSSTRATIRRRQGEFLESANLIGATPISLDIREDRLDAYRATKETLAVVRDVAPDGILALRHDDYHHQHRIANNVAFEAAFNAPAPAFKTRQRKFPWREVSALPDREIAFYEMDPQGLKSRDSWHEGYDEENIDTPGLVVKLTTEELAVKTAVYEVYYSQQGVGRGDRIPYVEQLKIEASIRGQQAGFAFGEGLTQVSYGGETFTTRNLLQEMLPGEIYDLRTLQTKLRSV